MSVIPKNGEVDIVSKYAYTNNGKADGDNIYHYLVIA